jgi:hypothetical protein
MAGSLCARRAVDRNLSDLSEIYEPADDDAEIQMGDDEAQAVRRLWDAHHNTIRGLAQHHLACTSTRFTQMLFELAPDNQASLAASPATTTTTTDDGDDGNKGGGRKCEGREQQSTMWSLVPRQHHQGT